jgi:Raf kinase inhibitor-like YbhB/YbcL family protein
MTRLIFTITLLVILSGIGNAQDAGVIRQKPQTAAPAELINLELKSSAFRSSAPIPKKYTCDSLDISPDLTWKKPPDSTRSLVLICDDPDAPGGAWIHWVLYNIPPGATSLPEGIAPKDTINGMTQGTNSFGNIGYGGPCPPHGRPHRYYFHLCAIDIRLDLKPGAKDSEIMKAITGHILAQGRLMGRYGRP